MKEPKLKQPFLKKGVVVGIWAFEMRKFQKRTRYSQCFKIFRLQFNGIGRSYCQNNPRRWNTRAANFNGGKPQKRWMDHQKTSDSGECGKPKIKTKVKRMQEWTKN